MEGLQQAVYQHKLKKEKLIRQRDQLTFPGAHQALYHCPSSTAQERENRAKFLWVKIRTRRYHSPITEQCWRGQGTSSDRLLQDTSACSCLGPPQATGGSLLPCRLSQSSGSQLPYHGLHQCLQGNLSLSTWSIFHPSFFTDLDGYKTIFFPIFSLVSWMLFSAAVFTSRICYYRDTATTGSALASSESAWSWLALI